MEADSLITTQQILCNYKMKKSYVKNHISIDVESRLIIYFAAQRAQESTHDSR